MKQAVMISIHPKWCELIANGKKTIEVRKTRPKIDTPFKCYIYETKGKIRVSETLDKWVGGKVIGEFVCDWCECLDMGNVSVGYWLNFKDYFVDFGGGRQMLANSCITCKELLTYSKGKRVYGWHISDLKMYDKPKELSEFARPCDRPNGFTCLGCKRFIHDHQLCCDDAIKRPFQSWGYVELRMNKEIEE